MWFYFKRDEVVFEHGVANQALAQDPKPKCPALDRLFPELDLDKVDAFLKIFRTLTFVAIFFIQGHKSIQIYSLTLKSWLSTLSTTTSPLRKGKQRRKKSCKENIEQEERPSFFAISF